MADAYATDGAKLASSVPYRTRVIVRRPVSADDFNGTVLVEWQNVTAGYDLDALWNRRHSTKFNGVAYPIQKAAASIFTEAGKQQTRALTDFYLGNAKLIREAVARLGFSCVGGDNAPYIWINTGRDSWEFFDLLLNKAQVVCTPGAGFGKCGEGHVRISAFNSRENVETALARIAAALK